MSWLAKLWKKIVAWFKDDGDEPPVDNPPNVPPDNPPDDPDPEPQPVPDLPSFTGHNAVTWFDIKIGTHNTFSPSCPWDTFTQTMARCRKAGADSVNVYASNYKDGAWGMTLYRDNKIGGELDPAKVAEWSKRIRTAWTDYGLASIVWLHADDSGPYNGKDEAAQKRFNADVADICKTLPVIGFCVGLEIDEYWDKSFALKMQDHLISLVSPKKVGVHMTGVRKLDWVRQGLFAQYGVNRNPPIGASKNAAEIESITRDTVKKLGGRWLSACEYNLACDTPQARALGDAAMRGGAIATDGGRNK